MELTPEQVRFLAEARVIFYSLKLTQGEEAYILDHVIVTHSCWLIMDHEEMYIGLFDWLMELKLYYKEKSMNFPTDLGSIEAIKARRKKLEHEFMTTDDHGKQGGIAEEFGCLNEEEEFLAK